MIGLFLCQRPGPSIAVANTVTVPAASSLVVSELEYRDGQVVSGTLEALVDLLRPGADRTFIFAFLLCCRIYVRPHELLATLCRRHTSPGQVNIHILILYIDEKLLRIIKLQAFSSVWYLRVFVVSIANCELSNIF